MSERDTTPTPASGGAVKIHGPWGSVAIPTVVASAIVVALTNWLTRPAPEAHAAPSDETRQDIRELRADEKEILRRLGSLEDATKNLGDSIDRLRPKP